MKIKDRKKVIESISKKAFFDQEGAEISSIIDELSHLTDSEEFAHEVFVKLLNNITSDKLDK